MQQQWLDDATQAAQANFSMLLQLSENSVQGAQSLLEMQADALQRCALTSQQKVQQLATAKDVSEYVSLQSDMLLECSETLLTGYSNMVDLAGNTQSEFNTMITNCFSSANQNAAASAPAPAKKQTAVKKSTKAA